MKGRRPQLPPEERYPIPDKAAAFFTAEEWGSWRDGSWDEWRVSEAINKRVATAEERKQMFDAGIDYATMVNGRVEGEENQALSDRLFEAWNDRLGYKVFGF